MPKKAPITIKIIENKPNTLVTHIAITTNLASKDLISLAKKVVSFINKNKISDEQKLFAIVEPTIAGSKQPSLREIRETWTSDEVRSYIKSFDKIYTVSNENKIFTRVYQGISKVFNLLIRDSQKFEMVTSLDSALESIQLSTK